MGTSLGEKLKAWRAKSGLTLREVESATGIHNAHLSQIEGGTIERPDPNILWKLSRLYDDGDFDLLMRLAGHVKRQPQGKRPLLGIAYRAIGELTTEEQEQVLQYIESMHRRKPKGTPPK